MTAGFYSWSSPEPYDWSSYRCPCGGHPRKPKRPAIVNGWVVPTDAARAVGRFRSGGPLGYRAATLPGAPLRASRPEAVADEMAYRTANQE